jgi:hypothetical protein
MFDETGAVLWPMIGTRRSFANLPAQLQSEYRLPIEKPVDGTASFLADFSEVVEVSIQVPRRGHGACVSRHIARGG